MPIKKFITSLLSFFYILFTLTLTSGCSIHVTQYIDGPVAEYVTQPIPQLIEPLARTLSVEKVTYNTAGGYKATMISDLVTREMYILPANIGKEVKLALQLDDEFDEKATYKGLNIIAKNREKARNRRGKKVTIMANQATINQDAMSISSNNYIRQHESIARSDRQKGNYLTSNIHTSAAANMRSINQSFSQMTSAVNTSFAFFGAMGNLGEQIIKEEFTDLRNWIDTESGAIGETAPEGTHLSVFFLEFFDAKRFKLDSRNRAVIYLVLSDENGTIATALEGSDILTCVDECDVFQPKSTAKIYHGEYFSEDVKKQISTMEGIKYLQNNGFASGGGRFHYLLLRHGLKNISSPIIRKHELKTAPGKHHRKN